MQPGPSDGGGHHDEVGTTDAVGPLDPNSEDNWDCASVALDSGVDVDRLHPANLAGTGPRLLGGEEVRKLGRTSGLTTGIVSAFDVRARVLYERRHWVILDGQFEVQGNTPGAFSHAGDSGSLVWLVASPLAVGLLFAGTAQGFSYVAPIDEVMGVLEAQLVLH
jgi:hypothetical protein